MGKNVLFGIGTARKVKKMYLGVDGKARRIKKGYIGIGNVARQFFNANEFIGLSYIYGQNQLYVIDPAGTVTATLPKQTRTWYEYGESQTQQYTYLAWAGMHLYTSGYNTQYLEIDPKTGAKIGDCWLPGGSDTTIKGKLMAGRNSDTIRSELYMINMPSRATTAVTRPWSWSSMSTFTNNSFQSHFSRTQYQLHEVDYETGADIRLWLKESGYVVNTPGVFEGITWVTLTSGIWNLWKAQYADGAVIGNITAPNNYMGHGAMNMVS